MKTYCCIFAIFLACACRAQEVASHSSAGESYEQGLVLMMAGEAVAALLAFEAAVKAAPDYVEAYLAMGDLHLQTEEHGKARRAYERALQIQPQAPGAHVGLGHVVWQTEQDPQQALEFYRAALDFDLNHAEATYFAGKMLAAQNQAEAALPILEKAIQLAPQAYEPHLSLGLCRLMQRDYEAAKAHWQAAKNKGGMPYVLLEWSRNLLATVAENGILITASELETHPLLYLQECEGLRRDVGIVNLNLLSEVWYIQMLRDRAPRLDIRFDDEYLTGKLRPRLLPAAERMEAAGLSWILSPAPGQKNLRVQDLMLLKIIAWNEWQRPLFFAITVAPSEQLGLQDYLSLEGLAWRLCRNKVEALQPKKIWENVRENYFYEHVKEVRLAGNAPALLANYGKIFCLLAEAFYQRREFAPAGAALAWGDSAGVFKDAASNDWAARLAGGIGEKMIAAKFQARAALLRRQK